MNNNQQVLVIPIDANNEPQAANPEIAGKWSTNKKLIVFGTVLLGIIGFILVMKYVFKSPNILYSFVNFCESLSENNIQNFALTFVVIFCCQFFFLPGQSSFVAVSAYFIGHYWPALIRFVVILWPIKLIGFFIVKHCIYKRIYASFHDSDIYQAINIESRKNAWLTSMLMNMMWIMSSVKMYIIPLLSITWYQFLPFMLVGEVIYTSLFVLIGIEVRDVYGFLNGSYTNLTPAQKMSYLLFLVFTIVTIGLLVVMLWVIYRRVMTLKRIHQEQLLGIQNQNPQAAVVALLAPEEDLSSGLELMDQDGKMKNQEDEVLL